MPKGIVIIRWDDKVGIVEVGKFPRELNIDEQDEMRIFTAHAFGKPDAGFLQLSLEEQKMNAASYYSGRLEGRDQYCISLFLDEKEDARTYEEPLTEESKYILDNIDRPIIQDILKTAYERMIRLVSLAPEQQLARVFSDDESRMVFFKLTEGPIPENKLRDWLELQTGNRYSDMNLVLMPLTRARLIRQEWIRQEEDNCVFLVWDCFGSRVPPVEVLNSINLNKFDKSLVEKYKNIVTTFFQNYNRNEKDIILISKLITEPDIYEIIKALRKKPISREELSKKIKTPTEKIDLIIRQLVQHQIIYVSQIIQDEKSILVLFPLSDIQFERFYPEHLIPKIQTQVQENLISKVLGLRHLDMLREAYRSK